MNRELLIITAHGNLQRLMTAQSLSSALGESPVNLVEIITQLVLWIRDPVATFEDWHRLMNQAGAVYLTWYDWYSGIQTRSMDDLGGLSLLEWYESAELNWEAVC